MARETRAATGNSKPRVFPVVEPVAAPKKRAIKPKAKANTAAKRAPKTTTTAKGSKPTGVTKKAAPKKKTPVAKAEGDVKKAVKKVTPKTKAPATKKAKAPATKK